MPRATKPTRVYRYGACVLDGLGAYHDEERAMHRAYNALVELRRREIEASREVLREHVPWVAETEAELERIASDIEAARAEIKRRNSAQRKREPEPELRARIRALTVERRQLTGRHDADTESCDCFRCRRKHAYVLPEVATPLAEIGATFHTERKRLYAEREISWPNWNQVTARLPRRGYPQFRAWRNTGGFVVAQVQDGGARWADLLAGEASAAQHVRVEATERPAGTFVDQKGRSYTRSAKGPPHYLVRLRVGPDSRQRQEHRWITARMTLHRPVPEDAIVQQVQLVRRRVGTHDQWHVHLVLSREAGWAKPCGDGKAALNLGFRATGGGERRVGYLVDGEDGVREFRIPARWAGALRKTEDLQRIRDERFALGLAAFREWLAVADVPEWLSSVTATLAQWRSQARLAALVIRWRAARFSGDTEIFERLEAWRRRDRHLYDWQAYQRKKVSVWRAEAYRGWAAELRRAYGTVYIDDTDYRAFMQTPAAEDHEDPERLNTRWFLRLSAPGQFRDAIVQAGVGRPVDPAGATITCSICGTDAAGDWDRVSELAYRCTAGHVLDQDLNAAANLLARYSSGGVVAE